MAAGWEAPLIKRVGDDVLGVVSQPRIVDDDPKTLPISLSPVTSGTADPPDTSLVEHRWTPARN